MKIASTPCRIFFKIEGKRTLIIISEIPIRIKQTALIFFIGNHPGIMFFSGVISKTHPARPGMLSENTTIIDTQAAFCNETGKSIEYQ
jgi:hypothetical protein